ncbi:hypothetical protein [Methylobacterium gnaphalii]|uniref:Uncharacterized protein n=1 Tax=Methylobacterium gnaphalii TaxID=1010610 RepID=A0A512JQV4_9HYPH|nr:hypothetical protein [Methylobacterium gnaphalii]GEP12243.1 hypothetical protein MGN01_40880 [Methylobacterium gnaphalii]GJD70562.1 hypothetical protein MMMDOFMJ_3511 [Methylobacterium gnaphalii]GLS48518.1 hypothetical protein GCM10007885_13620 [Methylobacterium gnaphalii]
MTSTATIRTGEWRGLEQEVFERVKTGMVCNAKDCDPTTVFVRKREHSTRRETERQQPIKIVGSGQCLDGDRSNVAPFDELLLKVFEDER